MIRFDVIPCRLQSRAELANVETEASDLTLQRWVMLSDSKENQLTQMKLKLAKLLTEKRNIRASARDQQRDAVVKYRQLLISIARAKFRKAALKREVR